MVSLLHSLFVMVSLQAIVADCLRPEIKTSPRRWHLSSNFCSYCSVDICARSSELMAADRAKHLWSRKLSNRLECHHMSTVVGVAVSSMMFGTTVLIYMVMLMIWETNFFLATAFLLCFGFIDMVFTTGQYLYLLLTVVDHVSLTRSAACMPAHLFCILPQLQQAC